MDAVAASTLERRQAQPYAAPSIGVWVQDSATARSLAVQLRALGRCRLLSKRAPFSGAEQNDLLVADWALAKQHAAHSWRAQTDGVPWLALLDDPSQAREAIESYDASEIVLWPREATLVRARAAHLLRVQRQARELQAAMDIHPASGLPGARSFEQMLELERAHFRRKKTPFGLIRIDLSCPAAAKAVAEIVRRCARRATDAIFHVEDRALVCLLGATPRAGVGVVAGHLMERVPRDVRLGALACEQDCVLRPLQGCFEAPRCGRPLVVEGSGAGCASCAAIAVH